MLFKDFASHYGGLYIPVGCDGGALTNTPLTFDQVKRYFDFNIQIAWVPNGYIIIDIHDKEEAKVIFKFITQRKEKVMVVETDDGIEIYAKTNKKFEIANNVVTAVGAVCNVKDRALTHFRNPNGNYKQQRKLLYFNGIQELPVWLTPLYTNNERVAGVPNKKEIQKHISKSNEYNEIEQCVDLIKQIVPGELINVKKETLQFFDGSSFLHDRMGGYLIDKLHIKKDAKTKLLYYYDDRLGIYVNNNEYLKSVMTVTCPSLKDFHKKEVISYLDAILETNSCRFNEDPYKVVFKNGRLDVTTLEFEPHDPSHLETIQLNVNWNPKASGVTADEFFNTATCGDDDTKKLLYEAIGYSFLKTQELAKAFLLYGNGRTGKSTFLDILKEICGQSNCTAVSFKDMGEKFRVAQLYNKLVSLSGDISAQPLKDSDLFKQITGGDEITIENKGQTPFTSSVYTTLFFSANKLPKTPDTTYGFYRRLIIVPFNANLSNVSPVEGVQFYRRLMKDLEYIAYNAVLAIREVLTTSQQFTVPACVEEIMTEYQRDNSSVLTWLHEEKNREFEGTVIDQVYVRYSWWCGQCKLKALGFINFRQEFSKATGFKINGDIIEK